MKQTKYFRYATLLLALLGLAGFSSCSDDDDTDFPLESIVGEWFTDSSSGGQVSHALMTFTADGKFSDWEVHVGATDNTNSLDEGTYTYDGTLRIVTTSKYDPRHYYQEFRVNSVNNYTLELTDEHHYYSASLHRIVDTYTIGVGKSKPWAFSSYDFTALNYHSCDEKIATVDESGIIHAVKRGTTFIRAISSTDEAVIRVVVSDPDNVMDDYTKYLGKPLDQLITDIGSPFLEFEIRDGIMESLFHPNDEYIREMSVSYLLRSRTYQIDANFQDRADIQPVIASFDAKYTKYPASQEYLHLYSALTNGTYVTILLDELHRVISYQWDQDPLDRFDGMILTTIDNFASWFGFDLSGAENGNLLVNLYDDDIFRRIEVMFDEVTRKIIAFQLVSVPDISEEFVRAWMEQRYVPYEAANGQIFYMTTKAFARSEYFATVTRNADTRRIYINYLHNTKTL